jgi:hypothetical protein
MRCGGKVWVVGGVHPSFALQGVRCCIWRPATTRPAFQPGARPPTGGSNPSVSMPARARSHEISEFEFHISPVRSSSRPHTGVGTEGARSRTRCARTMSVATRTGPDTAWARSGMEPPRQRRISYRKCRNRPSQLIPTGPPATTPRSSPRRFRVAAHSMTNRSSGSLICSAEWIVEAMTTSIRPGADHLGTRKRTTRVDHGRRVSKSTSGYCSAGPSSRAAGWPFRCRSKNASE